MRSPNFQTLWRRQEPTRLVWRIPGKGPPTGQLRHQPQSIGREILDTFIWAYQFSKVGFCVALFAPFYVPFLSGPTSFWYRAVLSPFVLHHGLGQQQITTTRILPGWIFDLSQDCLDRASEHPFPNLTHLLSMFEVNFPKCT